MAGPRRFAARMHCNYPSHWDSNAGLVSAFVAADQKLCRVAIIEGFTALTPEQPITLNSQTCM